MYCEPSEPFSQVTLSSLQKQQETLQALYALHYAQRNRDKIYNHRDEYCISLWNSTSDSGQLCTTAVVRPPSAGASPRPPEGTA